MTEEITTEKEKPKLEDLPMHALRKALSDKDIKYKNTDKKADLIKMLQSGETKHKPKEHDGGRPKHGDKVEVKAKIPQIPESIRGQLEEMRRKGLTWEIDVENCGITFKKDLDSYTSLDAPANNILLAARFAFGKNAPIEQGRGNNAREW